MVMFDGFFQDLFNVNIDRSINNTTTELLLLSLVTFNFEEIINVSPLTHNL